MIDLELILLALAVYLLAGTVKGIVGIGLPTASIGILSQFIDPKIAIALVVFPILFSNPWQIFRSGRAVESFKTYWLFCVFLMIFLGAMTTVTSHIETGPLILILGCVIVVFAATSLIKMPPELPAGFDRWAQSVGGALGGAMGGLTGIWSPPMVIYLLARRVDKDEFVRATGMMIFMGGIPLYLGFWHAGLLDDGVGWLSLGMVIPSLLGFTAGEFLRRKLDGDRFRTVVLAVFLLMGLNLIRKALLTGV
ncbi:MAG: sulfite exporter TauE/SafE family protein [Pseudomonadota bacterium]